MGTTTEKLQKVLDSKNAIKNSIINKGVSIDDTTPFSQYASAIDSISSKGNPIERTVTPTKSQQIVTPDDGYYLSKVTVNAIPSSYIIPSGKINITNTSVINVSKYATAQIVDSNLVKGNIKNGVSILGVTGTYKGSAGKIFNDYY